jgi:hypothetical protein
MMYWEYEHKLQLCAVQTEGPLQVMWTDTTQDGITHVCQYLSQNATLHLQFHIILVLHVLFYLIHYVIIRLINTVRPVCDIIICWGAKTDLLKADFSESLWFGINDNIPDFY